MKTVYDLVLEAVKERAAHIGVPVDGDSFVDQGRIEMLVRLLSTNDLLDLLKTVGYSVPQYSGTVELHVLREETDVVDRFIDYELGEE